MSIERRPSLWRRGLRGLQPLMPQASTGLAILIYHLVGAGTDAAVDVFTTTFRHQMQWLRENFRIATLDAALGELSGNEASDGLLAVVTFDDAFRNFYEIAFPILEELSIPATLYVPVGFVAKTEGAPLAGAAGLPPCTWSQLGELAGTGLVSIGSHTVSHPNLCRLPPDKLEAEVRESRHALEDRLGVPVTTLAYPQALWNRDVEVTASRHYDNAVAAGGRIVNGTDWSPHRLPRFPIRRDAPPLATVLSSKVWIEELIADWMRRHVTL